MKSVIVQLCSNTPLRILFTHWKGSRLPILMLHRFSAEPMAGRTSAASLENFLQLAKKRGWSGLRLDELAQRLDTGRLPKKCFCLTVDDGYRDFADVAHPLLQQFDVPATVFLTTDFVDAGLWQWWDRVEFAFEKLSRPAAGAFVERLKSLPQVERLQHLEELELQLADPLPPAPPERFAAMGWEQVRRLAALGVEFGAHTVTHPILSQLSTEEEVRAEIHGSIEALASATGEPVRSFAFPNGRDTDFDGRSLRALENSELRCAVTTQPRFLDAQSWRRPQGRWTLPRLSFPETRLQQSALLSGFEAAKASLRGE
jgi:peptidoglycan/xylan/chitin deacetylase (PgdA/CDA1 family)